MVKTKVICIKDTSDVNEYHFKSGEVFYMVAQKITEVSSDSSVIVGYYIFDDYNSIGCVVIKPTTYNKCFLTIDKWREEQLNKILYGCDSK